MAKKPPRKPPVRKSKARRPLPVCKAFLICEKVICDQWTAAATLVGLFTEFVVPVEPAVIRPFWLFLQLSDGVIGEYPIEVEVQDLDRGMVIHQLTGPKAVFTRRPEKFDVMMQMPPFVVPGAGTYAVVAFADGQVVAEQLFTVRDAGSGNEPADNG